MPAESLPCGVLFDDLVAHVVDHAPLQNPEHQRSCPSCRAALAEISALWAPVQELAREHVRAPAGLLESVMARVRELPRHTWYAVIPTADGDTRIAARVVGAVARLAAEEVPQVSLALGGGRTGAERSLRDIAGDPGEAATNIGVAGTHVVVDVQVVVDMGAHIPGIANDVRARICERIADFTGLTTAEVNVTIIDVLTPPADGA